MWQTGGDARDDLDTRRRRHFRECGSAARDDLGEIQFGEIERPAATSSGTIRIEECRNHCVGEGGTLVDVGGIGPVAIVSEGPNPFVPDDFGKHHYGAERRPQLVRKSGDIDRSADLVLAGSKLRYRLIFSLRHLLCHCSIVCKCHGHHTNGFVKYRFYRRLFGIAPEWRGCMVTAAFR